MEQLSLAFKKTLSFFLVIFVSFVLSFGVLAQASLAQATGGTQQSTQGSTYLNGNQGSGGKSLTLSEQGAINGIAGCAASVVGGVVSQVTLGLFKSSSSENYTSVGTFNNQDVARAGGSTGWPPSLDSIGYCIINAVIEMLTQATIDWINSGFDGNPAFVENPEQFFKDIADTTAASFLQQVAKGTTGIDICQPFRLQIVTGLAGAGNTNRYANQAKCTLANIGGAFQGSGVDFNYQDYTSGNSAYGGSLDAWWNVTQNDQNNPYGAYFMAQKELAKRLTVKQNTANLDLTMGKGFLSFKSCTKDSTTTGTNGETVPVAGTCRVTTPGGVIEDQVNRSLGAGRERLIVADKFDQVISALVNQLIKTALNEVLSDEEK